MRARKKRRSGDAARAWLAEIGQAGELVEGLAPGQRLHFWIGQAAQAQRIDAGVTLETIAAETGGSKEALKRFEKGTARPQDLEKTLVAYAKLTNLADPREIVANGVRRWYESGYSPAEDLTASADAAVDDDLPPGELPG